MTTRRLGLALVLAASAACDPSPHESGDETSQDVCGVAQAHLSDCFGEPVVLDADCDPAQAEGVLAQSCAALTDSKADGGAFLCDLGLIRFCPEPVCETDVEGDPQTCADFVAQPGCSACEFYTCKDEARAQPCGDDGYYVDYGFRYCNRFSEYVRPRLSARGQVWVEGTRECLQSALDDVRYDELDCEQVRREAYDSHPPCYAQWGFCELPLRDIWVVVNTVDPADLELRQALVTGLICLRDLFDPTSLELSDEGVTRLIAAGITESSPSVGIDVAAREVVDAQQ